MIHPSLAVDRRLNNVEILTYESFADTPPSLGQHTATNWRKIYTIPTPPQNFYQATFSATVSSRYIAAYNPNDRDALTIREFTVEGFSQEGE